MVDAVMAERSSAISGTAVNTGPANPFNFAQSLQPSRSFNRRAETTDS